MKAARHRIGLVPYMVLALALGAGRSADAQIGLQSRVAEVALVARSLPQGAISEVEPAREIGRAGTIVEASVVMRWIANTGHRLVVRGGSRASRIWVQDVNGKYQELTAGSPVTVARDPHGLGERERAVRYRMEVGGSEALTARLPVHYEIAVNPAI